ncbi:uncharacterized protein [Rutidosis leptorrhynchoides]|uniref:uncharacterized protein n=1 Tax=Rutidosis leptorrhynchoides TaxID=125765 RepID=UPI003A990879
MKTRGGLSRKRSSYSNEFILKLVNKVTAEKAEKKRDKKRDRMIFGEGPMKIPRDLYDLIKEAVQHRRRFKSHPDNQSYKDAVLGAEYDIEVVSDMYKGDDLPRKWKYDPDIAQNLVENNRLVPVEYKDTVTYAKINEPPREIEIPETRFVHLNEREKTIWLDFKKFANRPRYELRSNPKRKISDHHLRGHANELRLLQIDHPMAILVGNFAVDTFNKAYQLLVNENQHKRIDPTEFIKCEYKISFGYFREYFFYMTIKAVEKGKEGLYETKVICDMFDGNRSLSRFILSKPTPENTDESSSKSEDEGDYEDYGEGHSSSSESEDEGDYVPEPEFMCTGMRRRLKDATCKGYDFICPYRYAFEAP